MLILVDDRARFGDLVVTLSEDDGPVQVETPDGVYTREVSHRARAQAEPLGARPRIAA